MSGDERFWALTGTIPDGKDETVPTVGGSSQITSDSTAGAVEPAAAAATTAEDADAPTESDWIDESLPTHVHQLLTVTGNKSKSKDLIDKSRLHKTAVKNGYCLEDVTDEQIAPTSDPFLWSFVQREADPSAGRKPEPWATRFVKNERYQLPFPFSGISYKRRLRSRIMSFTVEMTPTACLRLLETSATGVLFVTKRGDQLRSELLECKEKACRHGVMPLRISVVSYRTSGAPADLTPFNFQLVSDEVRALEKGSTASAAVTPTATTTANQSREWLKANKVETLSTGRLNDPGKAGSVVMQTDTYKYSWKMYWNTYYGAHTQPAVVYQMTPGLVTPQTMEETHAISGGPVMFTNTVVSPPSSASMDSKSIACLEQPNHITGECPNILSYYVTSSLVTAKKGTSRFQLASITYPQAVGGTGSHKTYCFRFLRAYYDKIADRLRRKTLKEKRLLDLSGGLTAVFTPFDKSQWMKTLVATSTTNTMISISVEIKLEYIVLGSAGFEEMLQPNFRFVTAATAVHD